MKLSRFLLSLILLGSFLVRLYRIDNPVADWHSWRQADTAAVSRNFLKSGFDLLRPRFDDLSSWPSLKENPQGYRFVEFPIYNLFQASLTKFFPQLSLEVWGRLVSIFSCLASIVFLYLIVKQLASQRIALLSAAIFAFLPFNIFYSRTILPDTMVVTFTLLTSYFLLLWIENNSQTYFFLSTLCFSIALLLKPFSLFISLAFVYLFYRKYKLSKRLFLYLIVFFTASLLPLGLWRWWMQRFPEGIPQNRWLFNVGNIRFKGAFFYWLFADRVGRLILGYWGLVPFSLGILVKPEKKEGWFFHLWLFSILLYFTVVAGGNVTHDYYQIPALPIIAVFFAKGLDFLLFQPKNLNRPLCVLIAIVTCLFSFAFSWYHLRDFFNINNPAIVKAGQAVDRLTPEDAKVIAPYGGDTAFLYQTNRRGWPIGFEIEKKISFGAQYYVNVNFDEETNMVMENYSVVEKTDDYVIVKLQ